LTYCLFVRGMRLTGKYFLSDWIETSGAIYDPLW
jgi:hypothetical protein